MKPTPTLAGAVIALAGAVALVFFGSKVFLAGALAMVAFAVFLFDRAARQDKERRRDAAERYLDMAADSAESPANRLRRALGTLRFEPGREQTAARLLAQLDAVEREYRRYLDLLGSRLRPGELTYDRYAGAGQKVYDLVVGAISTAAEQLPMAAARLPANAPGRSLAIAGANSSQADDWFRPALERNDFAIDQLRKINGALGSWGRDARQGALSNSLEELEELERRVRRYGA